MDGAKLVCWIGCDLPILCFPVFTTCIRDLCRHTAVTICGVLLNERPCCNDVASVGPRLIPRAVLLLTVAFSFGCNRNHNGQLPQSSGEPVAVAKEPVKGFVLVRAYPDQHDGELALALEFSQPLAATQEFDTLVRLEQDSGNHDGGGRCPMTPRRSVILMLRQTSTIRC